MTSFRVRAATVLPVVLLAGCAGWQSALDPKGRGADELARLFWFFTGICGVIWVLVLLVLAVAVWRRRAGVSDPLDLDASRESRMTGVVGGAVAVSAVILVGLTLLSFFANRTLADIGKDSQLTIRVTGHQWWWEVRYEYPEPDRVFTTANEIHIPAGQPVRLILASTDVIHSFWVPSLSGKLDLIPGRENLLDIEAHAPGVYRGQCAEFCGEQHANMAVLVKADTRRDFDAWVDAQIKPAPEPSADEPRLGHDMFLSSSCVMCHRIRGTLAGGSVAPDLTHLASRSTIAAGTLPLSRGNLAAWIIDPQGIKPGAHMPVTELKPVELNAIVAYLETLK